MRVRDEDTHRIDDVWLKVDHRSVINRQSCTRWMHKCPDDYDCADDRCSYAKVPQRIPDKPARCIQGDPNKRDQDTNAGGSYPSVQCNDPGDHGVLYFSVIRTDA